ncbi:trigger factor [Weissella koreensis]|uniref:Trigger factor n=1 Tax=Weissella koreensis TaxID=165096 RepID=A0A7H1MMY7_9LACO|nr:trigger factor [Weissella koreensis]AVH75619.1 trigger factor [Weissella koreensis]EJF34606.1 cell division trigger factor [Weissella koreensis KCTC 3621]QGN20842.1 trigger factor [Weissella koreensis]QNT64823.1 trigger factor [Weissella koreensis]
MVANNAEFTRGDGNKGTLKFEIPVEDHAAAIDAAFNKIKDTLDVPGFRKGKMPKQMFIARFGEEALYEDALNFALQEAYPSAIDATGIAPVNQPQIGVESLEKGQAWVISAEVEVAPEIELGDYKGLTVKKQDVVVSDADVDAEIETMRQGQAELVLAEDHAAENGDTVVIDFDGSVDGDHFEGGKGENFNLELGSGQFIPGFEEQLVGHKADESVEVKVTFPTDYQAEDLAGKEAVFETTIHEVKVKEVPALDDEFAKDVDEEVAGLEELKAKTKDRLAEAKKNEAAEAKEDEAVSLAVDNAKVVGEEIPTAMLEEDIHRQMNSFFASMQNQGISQEMYSQITGQTNEDIHKQYAEGAENRVKTSLVLEAIVKAEGITPDQAAIDAEVKSLADQYGMEEDAIRNALTDDMLAHDIAVKEAVNTIVDSAIEA